MNTPTILQDRIRRELVRYEYPTREWMIKRAGCDVDIAIVGNGYRALLLSMALFRERITNQLLLADDQTNAAEMYACMNDMGGHPRLDLIGNEFWMPDASFHSYALAARGDSPETFFGDALSSLWQEYLAWLHAALALSPVHNNTLAEIEVDAKIVRLAFDDRKTVRARRVVLAGAAADRAPSDITIPAECIPKSILVFPRHLRRPQCQDRKLLILGDDASSFDCALCALIIGEASHVIHLGYRLPQAQHQAPPAPGHQFLLQSFNDLSTEQRRTVLSACSQRISPVAKGWIDRLNGFGDRYRYQRLESPERMQDVISRMAPDIDFILKPISPSSKHSSSRIVSGREARGMSLAECIASARINCNFTFSHPAGAESPLVVYGSAAEHSCGPRAAPAQLARYALMDILETISCSLFLEDENELFDSFLAFRTSETFGGKLVDQS